MIKILFISQFLKRNGTETFMMNVFRWIDKSQYHVDFLIFTEEKTDYSEEVESAGCKVYRLPCRRVAKFSYYRHIDRFFKEHASKYNAIHFCGGSLTSIAPIYYAYKYGIPIRVVHAHSSSAIGFHNRLFHRIKRTYIKCIATHRMACSSMAAKWFFGNAPTMIIKNGIDISKFAYNESTRTNVRQQLGITEDTKVIGHVGRFVVVKNHTFIIDIFAEYVKLHPKTILLLIGIGQLMNEVKKKAVELDIIDKIIFLGERRDVNQLMQAIDLFLMPSLFEGLPFVLVEAQCSGLPCLLSDTINKDIKLTDGVEFYSLNNSASQWALKIDDVLAAYTRQGTDKKLIEAGYSIKNTVSNLEKIYKTQI